MTYTSTIFLINTNALYIINYVYVSIYIYSIWFPFFKIKVQSSHPFLGRELQCVPHENGIGEIKVSKISVYGAPENCFFGMTVCYLDVLGHR